MKKKKIDYNKQKEILKKLAPSYIEWLVFMLSCLAYGGAIDLKLAYLCEISSSIALVLFIYFIVWCVYALAIFIAERHHKKKEAEQNENQ